MSLNTLASHLQSAGRGNDSMLVHMTPGEVHGLQSLAMAHGGSLTTNPETGLPEAGFLSSILPAVAGLALAPLTAGTSLAFLGSPLGAALTVGGISALTSGSLKKGLMAGLGAAGGAGLGSSLAANAGEAAAANAVTPVAQQTVANTAAQAGESQALEAATGLTPQGGYAGFTDQFGHPITKSLQELYAQNRLAIPSVTTPDGQATFANMLSGAKNITGTPGITSAFLKGNLANIGMAAAPVVISDMLEQPTLGGTAQQTPGYIYDYPKAKWASTGADKQNTQTVYNEATGLPSSAEKNYLTLDYGPAQRTLAAGYSPIPQGATPGLYGLTPGQFNYWNPYRPPVTAADGGLLSSQIRNPVESMANANAIGANTGYPMANLPGPQYSANTARPVASNVFTPDAAVDGDTTVDAYSGEQRLARGGGISDLGGYSDGGRLLRGPGTGLSDDIPAQIGNKQPARLADGEFVIPADVVSAMGGGSTEAGAKKFYAMLDRIRRQAHGKKKQIRKVSDRVLPA